VQAIDARPEHLRELVRRAVDAELQRLVDAESAGRAAGSDTRTNGATATGRWKTCGESKPLAEFDSYRRACRGDVRRTL
jgi:hypothetical protein